VSYELVEQHNIELNMEQTCLISDKDRMPGGSHPTTHTITLTPCCRAT